MQIDLDQRTAGESFHSTVCVVGGGIAGLLLARRLAAHGIDVHLIEAGGLELEERSQALYQAEMPVQVHTGSHDGRFRVFGGSSTRWGAQILPYTSDIFDPGPGCPSLPWPISEDDISPYYADVQSVLAVDSLPFSADLLAALGHPVLPTSADVHIRFSKWAPFKMRNMAGTVGVEVLADARITVFMHGNTTSFSASPETPDRIASAHVLNYARQPFTFTASHFVVCAGTVESSRLLLSSPSVPNPHDQIGRYFHDHVSFHAARFESPISERVIESLGPFFVQGTTHTCKIEASAALREREHLLAVMAHVVIVEPEDSGAAAIRNMLRSLQRGKLKEAIGTNLLPVVRGIGDVVRLVLYARFKQRRAVSKRAVLYLNIDAEQAPLPENRIRLSPSGTDALGLPKAVVEWRVGLSEQDAAIRFAHLVRPYLQAAGIDPQHWDQNILSSTPPAMADTYHAMGGLRMGTDPTQSCVDPNLRVHGLKNLSIASCAVYPSGGSSNPTFTLMALSLRLADHLASQLGT